MTHICTLYYFGLALLSGAQGRRLNKRSLLVLLLALRIDSFPGRVASGEWRGGERPFSLLLVRALTHWAVQIWLCLPLPNGCSKAWGSHMLLYWHSIWVIAIFSCSYAFLLYVRWVSWGKWIFSLLKSAIVRSLLLQQLACNRQSEISSKFTFLLCTLARFTELGAGSTRPGHGLSEWIRKPERHQISNHIYFNVYFTLFDSIPLLFICLYVPSGSCVYPSKKNAIMVEYSELILQKEQ